MTRCTGTSTSTWRLAISVTVMVSADKASDQRAATTVSALVRRGCVAWHSRLIIRMADDTTNNSHFVSGYLYEHYPHTLTREYRQGLAARSYLQGLELPGGE